MQIFTHGSNQGSFCPQGQPGAKQLNTDKWTPAVKKGLVGGWGGGCQHEGSLREWHRN